MKKLIIFFILSLMLISCSTVNDYIIVLAFSKQLHTTIYDSDPSDSHKKNNTVKKTEIKENTSTTVAKVTTEDGEKVLDIDNKIYFAFNSYELREDSLKELDNVYNYLVKNRDQLIVIEGDTDSVGDYYYNIYLSEMRARNIALYLSSKGIAKNRLKYIGFGFTKDEGKSRRESRSARFVIIHNNEELNRYKAKNENGEFIKVRGLY